jgi:hypothetical protein
LARLPQLSHAGKARADLGSGDGAAPGITGEPGPATGVLPSVRALTGFSLRAMRLLSAILLIVSGLLIASGLLIVSGAGAVAQEGADCGQAYKSMLSVIERKKPRLSPEAQVALERTALRLYNACQTGHLDQPGELFNKLDRTRY